MSRYFETHVTNPDDMSAAQRKRRNYPVTDMERTLVRTYRDLLVFRGDGATLNDLYVEGHNRFAPEARQAALETLIALGHVDTFAVVRSFPATAEKRALTRNVVLYRLTEAGVRQAEASLTAKDRDRVEHRRDRLASRGGR